MWPKIQQSVIEAETVRFAVFGHQKFPDDLRIRVQDLTEKHGPIDRKATGRIFDIVAFVFRRNRTLGPES